MFRKIVIRILLAPFSLIYGIIISFVNYFYDIGLLKGSKFSIPVISVGNLVIGGAGKTPHIEYLINMLREYIDVGTLSRGYKRQTTGFMFVKESDTAIQVGDEPLQFKRKYPDITVAVGENRAYAIPQMIKYVPNLQTILLDDAFQHRGVKPGLSILLTAYDSLFTDDYLLPAGRLREWRSGYKRADIIIVSKCPLELNAAQRDNIIKKIKPKSYQKIYFSYYEYDYPYNFYQQNNRISLDKGLDVVLLSAIASTNYLLDYLQHQVQEVHEIEYEDHHIFDIRDIEKIVKIYGNMDASRKIILTTEKDAMRLEMHKTMLQQANVPVFILPARVKFHFDEGLDFEKDIKSFLYGFEI